MIGIDWYINRFSAMTFPEMFFRGKQVFQRLTDRYVNKGYFPRGKIRYASKPVLTVDHIPAEPFDHFLYIFGARVDFTKEMDWHLDISSGNRFPSIYCRDLNTRTYPNRSAKHAWETNRFQFLTKVAVLYRQTHDDKYLTLFSDLIRSWITHNPYLTGIGWYNNIDVGIRLITWFLCWEILEVDTLRKNHPEFDEFVEKSWVPLIYVHCRHSFSHPSRFSSANNHAIAEYAGLYIAASKWSFRESASWGPYAKKGLEKEIVLQHSANGINKEEAAGYIQFTTDFLLISHIVAENLNDHFSARYQDMLKNIFYYIYHFTDTNCVPPYYGDEDDGRAFLLENSPDSNNFSSLIVSGAILFRDPVLKSRTHHVDAKNLLMLGNRGLETYDSIPSGAPAVASKFYSEEGQFFFKYQTPDQKNIFLYFNAAPLGYLSIAAHGHADVLSFQLNINNQPVIVDPGTYIYHSSAKWRDYFRSSLAHNTLTVDRSDPAKMGGPMIWLNHYNPAVIRVAAEKDDETVTATHGGYLRAGVKLTRSITFHKALNRIVILDNIELLDNESHVIEFPLHLHPKINAVSGDPNNYKLYYTEKDSVSVRVDPAFSSEIVNGRSEPLLGWYSRSFFKLEKTNTLYHSLTVKNSVVLKTEIILN